MVTGRLKMTLLTVLFFIGITQDGLIIVNEPVPLTLKLSGIRPTQYLDNTHGQWTCDENVFQKLKEITSPKLIQDFYNKEVFPRLSASVLCPFFVQTNNIFVFELCLISFVIKSNAKYVLPEPAGP